jgi:hypothetical protein
MDKEQYEQYTEWVSKLEEPVKFIFAKDFIKPAGTLLMHGYTSAREDMKVWFDPDLGLGLQMNQGAFDWRISWPTDRLYPSKRAYPERTDLTFAMLMAERHEYPIRFTNPTDWE